MYSLGRRTPTDFEHVEKYSITEVLPETVTTVERILKLPFWHREWDQGNYNACVGFGTSMMMSITNELQARTALHLPYSHKYNPLWLWNKAKDIDEWSDTNSGDNNGTSVRAGCDILRTVGHVRVISGRDRLPNKYEGIQANRWSTTVDQMRSGIAAGLPISIGVNWYEEFFTPENGWIGKGALTSIAGGHCVCIYGASDSRQAFRLKNSWLDWPLVWIPYKTMQRLLDEEGESVLITDY